MRELNETDNLLELAEYVMERIKIKVSITKKYLLLYA